MHIFLTGEIQVGKSTVIMRTLSRLEIIPGGFKTYFGSDRRSPDRRLYMNPAAETKSFNRANSVACFYADRPPQAFSDVFDTYGVTLIQGATSNKLIMMDECGSLESDALLFQKEVIAALEGSIPILGVVKLNSQGWTDRIRTHPRVRLITVTKFNRDGLPSRLADYYRQRFGSFPG